MMRHPVCLIGASTLSASHYDKTVCEKKNMLYFITIYLLT